MLRLQSGQSIECCYFNMFWSFKTAGFDTFIGNRVVLNPGLGGVRDVASAIFSHEQTVNQTESAV